MKKRLVIALVVILICIKAFFLAGIYADYNLKSHSVYYAKHTPHKKGVEPVLMMLIENLGSIYQPDIKGIDYFLDGKPAIFFYNKHNVHIGTFKLSYGLPSDRYIYNDWKRRIKVLFDKDFNVTDSYKLKNFKDVKIDKAEEHRIKQELYHQLKPLIDVQPEPWINLQWLFDQRYHDKFN